MYEDDRQSSYKLSYNNLIDDFACANTVYEDDDKGVEYCFLSKDYIIYVKTDVLICDNGDEGYKYIITKQKPDYVDIEKESFNILIYRKLLIYHDISVTLEYYCGRIDYSLDVWTSDGYDSYSESNIHDIITKYYKIYNECRYKEYLIIKEENDKFMPLLNEI